MLTKLFSYSNFEFMFKAFFTFLFSLVLISCSQPKNDESKDRIDTVCDKIMQSFSKGKISEAMHLIKTNSVVESASIDSLQMKMTAQNNGNPFSAYGETLSYEFIQEGKVNNIVVNRYYILRFKRYFSKFTFTLYNNGSDWTITNFNYNDEILEVLHWQISTNAQHCILCKAVLR